MEVKSNKKEKEKGHKDYAKEKIQKKKELVCVTGGTGFIAAHIVRLLLH